MGKMELPLRMTTEQYQDLFVSEADKMGVSPMVYIRWRLGLPNEPGAYVKLPPHQKEASHDTSEVKVARKAVKKKVDKQPE